jgi:hypothetical protein
MSKENIKFFVGQAPAQGKFISTVKEPMFTNTSSRREKRSQKVISRVFIDQNIDPVR